MIFAVDDKNSLLVNITAQGCLALRQPSTNENHEYSNLDIPVQRVYKNSRMVSAGSQLTPK